MKRILTGLALLWAVAGLSQCSLTNSNQNFVGAVTWQFQVTDAITGGPVVPVSGTALIGNITYTGTVVSNNVIDFAGVPFGAGQAFVTIVGPATYLLSQGYVTVPAGTQATNFSQVSLYPARLNTQAITVNIYDYFGGGLTGASATLLATYQGALTDEPPFASMPTAYQAVSKAITVGTSSTPATVTIAANTLYAGDYKFTVRNATDSNVVTLLDKSFGNSFTFNTTSANNLVVLRYSAGAGDYPTVATGTTTNYPLQIVSSGNITIGNSAATDCTYNAAAVNAAPTIVIPNPLKYTFVQPVVLNYFTLANTAANKLPGISANTGCGTTLAPNGWGAGNTGVVPTSVTLAEAAALTAAGSTTLTFTPVGGTNNTSGAGTACAIALNGGVGFKVAYPWAMGSQYDMTSNATSVYYTSSLSLSDPGCAVLFNQTAGGTAGPNVWKLQ